MKRYPKKGSPAYKVGDVFRILKSYCPAEIGMLIKIKAVDWDYQCGRWDYIVPCTWGKDTPYSYMDIESRVNQGELVSMAAEDIVPAWFKVGAKVISKGKNEIREIDAINMQYLTAHLKHRSFLDDDGICDPEPLLWQNLHHLQPAL